MSLRETNPTNLPQPQRARVLVVDDDAELRTSIRRSLARYGYEVDLAEDGRAALERAGRGYDLLLLDQRMPGLSGIEVLKRLRDSFDQNQLPIIMMSGVSEPELLDAALTTGANDYVAKPSSVPVLAARMKAQLERSRRERSAHARDVLTGLDMRAAFLEKLQKIDASSAAAVVFLDLDWFKEINDGFGHQTGDGVLREVAARLRGAVASRQEAADAVARLGGDEFVLLLTNAKPAELEEFTTHLCASLAEPCEISGITVAPAASAGIAPYQQGIRPEEWLRCADLAMYEAKRAGGGQWRLFDPAMLDTAHSRASLARDLRTAVNGVVFANVRNNESDFHAVYQPEYRLRDGRLTGFECLLRWRHFERGWVPPAKIIPVAEENGLIIPIGNWILEQACQQLARWQRDFPLDPPLTMAVNLSVKQLADPGLAASVERILASTGVIEGTLHFELTESSLMSNFELAREALESLRSLHVGLKLDDFGAGYSSLSYLSLFHFDCLKIDRSFVNGLNSGDAQSRILIQSMTRMAHELGLSVVAEGVENESQWSAVASIGCDSAQGFLMAKPLEPDAATALVEQEFSRASLRGRPPESS